MLQLAPILLVTIFAGLLAAAAVNDIRAYRIPNWVSIAIVALFPLYVLSVQIWGPPDAEVRWMVSLGITAVVSVILIILFALGIMGGGDVKLIAATSLWAGPDLITPFVLVVALSGGLVAIIALILVNSGETARKHLDNHAAKADSVAEPDYAETGTEISEKQDTLPIPYGVAIACGGFFISVKHIINHFTQ